MRYDTSVVQHPVYGYARRCQVPLLARSSIQYHTLPVGLAVHRSVTLPSPVAVAVRLVGGCGNGGIGRAVATLEGVESPARLVARRRKSYVVPLDSSVTSKAQQVDSGYTRRCQAPPLARSSIQ